MISISEAVEIFERNAPNKKIISINQWNGKYVFESRDKKLKDDEPDYDSTCEVIDAGTGEFSTLDWFNMDYLNNAKVLKTFK